MATTIAQQPSVLALCKSPVIITLYDAAYNNTNFKYVLDVFIWHGADASVPATRTYRLSRPPAPSNRATFDIKDFIAEYITQLTTINTTNTFRSGGTTSVNVLVKAGYTSDSGDSIANTTGTRFTSTYGYSLFTEGVNAKKTSGATPPQYTLTDRPTDVYIHPDKVSTLPFFQESTGVVRGVDVIDYTGASDSISINTSPTNSADRIKYFPIKPSYLSSATTGLDLTRDYTLNILDASDNILKAYNIHLVCEPKYEVFQVWFVNRYGVWDFILCNKRSSSTVRRESEDFHRNIAQFSGSSITYSTEKHSVKDYNVDGMESLTLNTGFQGEGLGVLITQLMMSEQILIDNSAGQLLPYRLKNTSEEIKKSVTDRNINYTLNFEPSFNIVNSIR